ncbi:MAG: hypothetical protein DWQ35_08575 [Planctomycetota bacterium]|nr:MAG: hypothetical protein DWQ35_08575 [Planctomycetota bacterium]
MAREDSQLESALVYALLFTAFAMFVLAMMASRYEPSDRNRKRVSRHSRNAAAGRRRRGVARTA